MYYLIGADCSMCKCARPLGTDITLFLWLYFCFIYPIDVTVFYQNPAKVLAYASPLLIWLKHKWMPGIQLRPNNDHFVTVTQLSLLGLYPNLFWGWLKKSPQQTKNNNKTLLFKIQKLVTKNNHTNTYIRPYQILH